MIFTIVAGSVLRELFSPAAVNLVSSYNRSITVMLELLHVTHRGLIESLLGRRHVQSLYLKRFLTMITSIQNSKKAVLQYIFIISDDYVHFGIMFYRTNWNWENLQGSIHLPAQGRCLENLSADLHGGGKEGEQTGGKRFAIIWLSQC